MSLKHRRRKQFLCKISILWRDQVVLIMLMTVPFSNEAERCL